MNPLISVILPAYNAIKYLDQAIKSILDQTYTNFELLIINDGSGDGTSEYLKTISDNRLRIFNLAENKGLVNALNLGIAEAKGEFIARMDADDVAHAQRFEKQMAYLMSDPETGICGSFAQVIDSEYVIEKPCDDEDLRWWIFRGIPFIHPSVMMRASVLKTTGIRYDETYVAAEDWEIWPRIAFRTKMHNLPECLLAYRAHEGQVSIPGNVQQKQSFELAYRSFLRSVGIDDQEFKRTELHALFTGELSADPGHLQLAFDFFKALRNSEAIRFFGKAQIAGKSAERLGLMLSNQVKFSWSCLKFLLRADFWPALKISGIRLHTYVFKCVVCWQTKTELT